MGFAIWYTGLTGRIVQLSSGADKFVHCYVGLAIWLGVAVILRRPRRSLLPLLILIAAELANEILDRLAHGSWRWRDTLGDAAATLFWPLVLTALLRWTRWGWAPVGR